ncbi:MAG: hypothetical protein JNM56_27215 [Planctomycetia bacterium]|nr:hypothetical protein [Planctomycetia bacterium]
MTSSPRDKVLAMILPALLTGLCYLYFYYYPAQQTLNKQHDALLNLRRNAPNVRMQLLQKQQKLAEAEAELKAVNDEYAQVEARWKALAGGPSSERLPAEKIEQLTALLIRNGMTVLECKPAQGEGQANVPPALQAVAKRIGEQTGGKPAQYRLRVAGSYLGLLRVLERVNEREPVAIPISLSMKEHEEGYREWVLVVWI